jgi:hypothetical protein
MFNTLKYTKLLEEVGVPRNQAEAQVQIIAEILEDDVATKSDLREVRNELKNDITQLEYRLVIKLGTIVTIALAAIATVVKFF